MSYHLVVEFLINPLSQCIVGLDLVKLGGGFRIGWIALGAKGYSIDH